MDFKTSNTRKLQVKSKLPDLPTTIFTVMSAMANEHGAINLSQGFPNFDCAPHLKELVNKAMQDGHNQYAPMQGVPILRKRIAEKINTLYNNPLTSSEVTITNGATEAVYSAVTAFVHPGDEVILVEPAYDSYAPSIKLAGGIVVPYELAPPNYRIDWEAFAKLITDRTRLIMINTPHNPTGTILKAADMEALQNITRNTDILIISDEVYEHLVYDGQLHESVLKYPELYERSVATFSFGKVFHNTGWRIGYCVAPPHLTKEFLKVHQFNTFSINSPMQYGLAEFLKDPNEYLSLSNLFGSKRDLFLDILKDTRFRPYHCEGTYFQLVDYSQISDEDDFAFAKRLTTEHGVAAIPVSVFYTSKRDEKAVRFCFGKTDELLEQAGELLRKI